MAASPPVNLEHKTISVVGVKILDAAEGIVEAFVAGIGNLDDVGDIIEPGFFESSLKSGLTPKGVDSHDWSKPVARTLEAKEVPAGDPLLTAKLKEAGAGGCLVKMQYNLKTQRGREAFDDVAFFGDEQEWSIGYVADEAPKDENGNRHLKTGLWYEYSNVLFGANRLTQTAGVKSAQAPEAKQVRGSYEELSVMLGEALKAEYLDEFSYVYVASTFVDSVIFIGYEKTEQGSDWGPRHFFRQGFTRDGSDGVITLAADREEVMLAEIVVPKDGKPGALGVKAKRSKSDVNYRDAGDDAEQKCGNCASYSSGACSLVSGTISASSTCDIWSGETMDAKELENAEKAIDALEAATPLLAGKAGSFIGKRERARLQRAADAINAVLGGDTEDGKEKVAEAPEAKQSASESLSIKDLMDYQHLASTTL